MLTKYLELKMKLWQLLKVILDRFSFFILLSQIYHSLPETSSPEKRFYQLKLKNIQVKTNYIFKYHTLFRMVYSKIYFVVCFFVIETLNSLRIVGELKDPF